MDFLAGELHQEEEEEGAEERDGGVAGTKGRSKDRGKNRAMKYPH